MFRKFKEVRTINDTERIQEMVTGVGNFTADCPPSREVIVNGQPIRVAGGYPLSVAFSTGKDKPAQFYKLEAWGKTAELLERFAKKGEKVFVYGRLADDSYQKEGGETISQEKLIVESFEVIRTNNTSNNNAQNSAPAETNDVPETFQPVFESDNADFDDIPF